MTTPIASDARGNVLLHLVSATSEELTAAAASIPCPLALVVLREASTGHVLFGRNRWREEYELPGGIVEAGESFHDAARRELEEESSVRVEVLELVGFARFALANPPREELGAVFTATLTEQHVRDSDELEAFVWRRPLSPSSLVISPLDDAIAGWASGDQL